MQASDLCILTIANNPVLLTAHDKITAGITRKHMFLSNRKIVLKFVEEFLENIKEFKE